MLNPVDAAAAQQEIGVLHATYADIATRMAWDELGAIVPADARFSFRLGATGTVEHVGADAVAAFGRAATSSFSYYSYVVTNFVLTRIDATHRAGRVHALELSVDRATGRWSEHHGVYDDDYGLVDGRWVYLRRDYELRATRAG